MSEKEFNLSDKLNYATANDSLVVDDAFILAKDVKEFIRLLKDEIKSNIAGSEKFYNDNPENLLDFIDKLSGDKLK